MDQKEKRAITILRKIRPIFPQFQDRKEMSMYEFIMKASVPDIADKSKSSKQKAGTGRKDHPFNFSACRTFRHANSHHGACLETKKNATVGLGFKNEKTQDILNSLCTISAQDVLSRMGDDYTNVANGYIEVIREEPRTDAPIIGLHHLQAEVTWINIEDFKYNRHFEVIHKDSDYSALWSGSHLFADFGDLEGFFERHPSAQKNQTSEVIHIPHPSAYSRWYGMPSWLPAVASIELKQALLQYNFDFFNNRGVPEFLLFLLGGDVGEPDMTKLEELLRANIGSGNAHKSGVFNLPQQDLTVQLEKLAMETASGDDGFSSKSETISLDIVSAHQTPPILAGIQIPGKLGAANEITNALTTFQTLVIAQYQKNISTRLGTTLGNPLYNGSLQLGPRDFEFKTILDLIDVQKADTAGRMKEPAMGNNERDLSQGVKD